MKVLLVFPNTGILTGEPPIGLGYIAACLRQKHVDVSILDMTFQPSFSLAQDIIINKKPDIVGIYTSTVMLKDAYKIALIAKNYGVKLVVLGGPHATVLPEETLGNSAADVLVAGEGEHVFCEIVDKFTKNFALKELLLIPSVYVKINNNVLKNDKRYFIADPDTIPFPARDLFDMKKYIKRWFQLDGVDSNLTGTNIFTSRGCPFSCSFCQPALKSIFGTTHRRRSPKNIADEIESLKETYGIKAVQIVDDLFFINESYIEDFCNQLLKRKLNVIWGAQSRIDTVPNDRILELAYKAGLRLMSLGIEAGTPRIVKLYEKKISLENVNPVIEKIRAHQIKTRGYFIIGAPTETVPEIKKTISFATDLRLSEAAFSVLAPFPGTYIHETAKSNGWAVTKNWGYEHYYARGGFLSGTLDDKVIRKYQRIAFLKFYFHPYRIKYLINSLLNPRKAFTKIMCYFF